MVTSTRCVVAGGGPGGVVLAYLLARAGVPVTLLEARGDFDRRFRGDALAPPVLDLLDLLGLADPLLAAVPHGRADAFVWSTPTRSYRLADYRRASAKYPYYALVPQGRFLPFMVEQAARYPAFRLEMGARVTALTRDDAGRVAGLEYSRDGQRHRLSADLVVGADGRNSKVRLLSSITATELGAHLDICWVEVPRRADDPALSGLELLAEPGATLAVLGQAASWQLGYTIPAGTFPALRAAGIGQVVAALRRRLPWLGDRLDGLTDVNQLSLLPVRITSVDRWSEPGLLLVGDAAHVISPVGGNGLNFALLDAVEAANRLVGPLQRRSGGSGRRGRGDRRGRGGPPVRRWTGSRWRRSGWRRRRPPAADGRPAPAAGPPAAGRGAGCGAAGGLARRSRAPGAARRPADPAPHRLIRRAVTRNSHANCSDSRASL